MGSHRDGDLIDHPLHQRLVVLGNDADQLLGALGRGEQAAADNGQRRPAMAAVTVPPSSGLRAASRTLTSF